MVAVVGSLGAPPITSVATTFHVSLASAQWTLTITLLSGAVAIPLLGASAPARRRATIIGTLAVVTGGSVLTVLPLPFGWLLAGRAAQGVGLGLTALMMGVARDHLDADRAPGVIALVSVASAIGIGVGYPLAGLLAEFGGIRAAYGLGAAVTVVALLTALRSMPAPPPGRSARVDIPGALLLAGGLLALLLVLSETSVWSSNPAVAATVTVLGLALLGAWAWHEWRTPFPLVDVRLLRHRAVATANITMLAGATGMYLLLTLITRFTQTPRAAGYGFGLTTFEAGLVLVPFSLLGFLGGRVTPSLRARFGARRVLAAARSSCSGFRALRDRPAEPRRPAAGDGGPGRWRRRLLGSHARGHPGGDAGQRDVERDELQPGGAQRGPSSAARSAASCSPRALRPATRSRQRRVHDGGVDRRLSDGGHGRDQRDHLIMPACRSMPSSPPRRSSR